MAPTLSSNSFLITSAPHPRSSLKSTPRFRVSAKGAGAGPFSSFQFGKSKDDDSSSTETNGSSGNSSPFSFNFGKTPDVRSLIPVVSKPASGMSFGRKDPGTVFVAGAAGQAGIRIAQTLLREGFKVRAGVPELKAAQELALLAAKYKIISNEEANRLNAVQSTFEDAESIAKAIGNASKVVVTIGPNENGPTSAVSTLDALQVIQAAQLARVGHVAIVYDGNAANASTYNVLDGFKSFFNNIFSQSQPLTVPEFLQKVIETDVGYTFIRTSLTEDFSQESSYNIVVSAERSTGSNDYKVAKSQIASVVANVFSNTEVAENKVVEVFTDPSAPSKSVTEFFSAIPKDDRRSIYAEALAKEKAEEEARIAAEKAREAANAAKKPSKEEEKAASLAEEEQERAVAAGASLEGLLNRAKGFSWGTVGSKKDGKEASPPDEVEDKAESAGVSVEGLVNRAKDISFSWGNLGSQMATTAGENLKVQIATVRGQARARSLPSQKAVVKKRPTPRLAALKPKETPKPKAEQTEKEVRKVFGGLFQQETIYIDDD